MLDLGGPEDPLADALALALFYDEAAAVAAEVAEGIGVEAADLVSSSIGEGAAAEGASISPEAMDSLVEGERVGSALKDDPYHMAPSWADPADIAKNAQQFSIRGYDGFTRTLVQSPGGVNGVTGRFEWIIQGDGTISHQLFVPNGMINGVPIMP